MIYQKKLNHFLYLEFLHYHFPLLGSTTEKSNPPQLKNKIMWTFIWNELLLICSFYQNLRTLFSEKQNFLFSETNLYKINFVSLKSTASILNDMCFICWEKIAKTYYKSNSSKSSFQASPTAYFLWDLNHEICKLFCYLNRLYFVRVISGKLAGGFLQHPLIQLKYIFCE